VQDGDGVRDGVGVDGWSAGLGHMAEAVERGTGLLDGGDDFGMGRRPGKR